MNQLMIVAADLVAITVLTFCVYFPRHHRRDLVVAFLAMNVGVLAVSMVLASSTVGIGLGLGLYGVLSIIRLRSAEIAQHEIAYYFSALAIGLLAGLPGSLSGLTVGLISLVIAVLFVGDHPRLFRRHRQQTVRLDVAHTDEEALRSQLEALLGGRVLNLSIKQIDLVNDTTLVEVRYVAGARVPQERGADIAHESLA
jgi:Ca2+/Na+ antiporter